MLFEIGAALIRQGFEHLVILNGNRPNGTANDAVARHLVDELDTAHAFKVSAVSYWEPAAEKVHAMRKSVAGGLYDRRFACWALVPWPGIQRSAPAGDRLQLRAGDEGAALAGTHAASPRRLDRRALRP